MENVVLEETPEEPSGGETGLAPHRVSMQGQDWKYSLAWGFSKVPFLLSLMLLFGELSVT